MSEKELILKVSHLQKSFGNHAVLNDIDFEVCKGDVVSIIGASGSGKSTMLRCINLLEEPGGGAILFHGQDITDMSITDRANLGISFAFQQPVRFKGVTVKDLICLASGQDLSTADACQYLSEVGMCAKDYIDREVNASLSGGELKRIEIATVMARKTKLTLFDEPEAGIDLWSFKNLIDVFEKMHEEIQGSIIIISHQERILNIADQVVLLSAGEVKQIGTKEDVLPGLFGMETGCRYFKGGEE